MHKCWFDFSHKREKSTSEVTSILLKTGGKTKTRLFSYLSAASKPVKVLCFSMTRNQGLSLVFTGIWCVYHVTLSFWKTLFFNWYFFSAFQWRCSVIQWMQTKMLGCYLQLTLVTNPSPEMQELLGSGEEKRRLFPTSHLQQETHLR